MQLPRGGVRQSHFLSAMRKGTERPAGDPFSPHPLSSAKSFETATPRAATGSVGRRSVGEEGRAVTPSKFRCERGFPGMIFLCKFNNNSKTNRSAPRLIKRNSRCDLCTGEVPFEEGHTAVRHALAATEAEVLQVGAPGGDHPEPAVSWWPCMVVECPDRYCPPDMRTQFDGSRRQTCQPWTPSPASGSSEAQPPGVCRRPNRNVRCAPQQRYTDRGGRTCHRGASQV